MDPQSTVEYPERSPGRRSPPPASSARSGLAVGGGRVLRGARAQGARCTAAPLPYAFAYADMYYVVFIDLCVDMHVHTAAPARATAAPSHVRLRPRSLTGNRYSRYSKPRTLTSKTRTLIPETRTLTCLPPNFVRVPVRTPLNTPRVAIEHLVESPAEVPREGPFSTP